VPRPPLPAPVRHASLVIGAAAVLCAVGVCAAVAALRNLAGAGPALLKVSTEYDTDVARIAEIHTELVIFAVISVVGLVLLAPLAFAVRRRWRAARMAAWIAGVGYAVVLTFSLAGGPDVIAGSTGLETPPEKVAIAHLLPDWYVYLTSLLTAAGLAAVIAFSILLARAGEFYRNVQATESDGLWRLRSNSAFPDGDRRRNADQR
jgi:uncharacterized membrane protein YhaH (DUF805 family)